MPTMTDTAPYRAVPPSASRPTSATGTATTSMMRRRPAAPPSIPYQVDLSTAKTGRHIQPTKRRVRFTFGLASLPHLGLGCTGPDARGFEHECLLLWSLASGKRRILLDGKEVHFSCGAIGQNSFSASFPLPGAGNHQMQLVANLSAGGTTSRHPATLGHLKHFDLRLDGQSFHDMLKIYELGGPRCRAMYGQAIRYAESLPREELERAARNIGMARGSYGSIRRNVPDRIVEHYEDATYASGELESSGVNDFDTITPRDPVEEKFMYEFAKQKSLRDGNSGRMRRNLSSGSYGPMARASSAPAPPAARDEIPSFGAVHGAFRNSETPPTGRPQQSGVPMRTIDESEDLIDLSSTYPSSQQEMATGGQRPVTVTRTPSDITIDMPDQAASDDVSVMADDASVVSGWGAGPQIPPRMMRGESTRSFAYAPAPTWEDACWAFGAGTGYGQEQRQQQQWQQPSVAPPAPSVAPSPSFAVPPSVAPTSTYAPTDASFAARAAPNMPGSGATFAFAPAPTWDDVQAQFSSPAPPPTQPQPSAPPPPPSGQWQHQQPASHYGGYTASSQSNNPFNPAYAAGN
mmetsp:Transcript_37106/g.75623  ORF Transcript_37106/g.75623 Transcript_37106/m.75623 type:complete len:576 (+) Transcript_37106:1183-2910(+)